MGYLEHKSDDRAKKGLSFYVITLSDTRSVKDDESGSFIKESLIKAGHKISGYKILKDEMDLLQKEIVAICSESFNPLVEAVIISGGTGISDRDITYEALKELYDKELYGFGELFRYLSYSEIDSSAVMSRASCGIYNERILFSIPGSINAVKLAMAKIILKEAGHLFYEITKHKT